MKFSLKTLFAIVTVAGMSFSALSQHQRIAELESQISRLQLHCVILRGECARIESRTNDLGWPKMIGMSYQDIQQLQALTGDFSERMKAMEVSRDRH